MHSSFWSFFLVLLLVIDPIGNVPIFLAALRGIESPARRRWVLVRECGLALAFLLLFLWLGEAVLMLLGLSPPSVGIAGGIVLFLISLRMIFDSPEKVFGGLPAGEPFLVPLAVPFLAGPSTLATLLLFASQGGAGFRLEVAGAVVLAMAASCAILLAGGRLLQWLGVRGLDAFQRLMGLVLTAMAMEMLLRGVREFVGSLR